MGKVKPFGEDRRVLPLPSRWFLEAHLVVARVWVKVGMEGEVCVYPHVLEG